MPKNDTINSGGPAVPQNDATINRINNHDSMSLRDYFAGQALAGWMANSTATPVEADLQDATPQDMADVAALFAYQVADAMIAARQEAHCE